jgi:hypothetical protein
MPKLDISRYNATWGICGFTSALTHLYSSDTRLRNKIDTSTKNTIRLGLLIEVLTFLKYVVALRGDLIDGLNTLNTELNSESMNDGVAGFIPIADLAIRNQVPIGGSNRYQCALTPEALELYLQVICGFRGATLTSGGDPGGPGILGLMSPAGKLVHWVYRDPDGSIYNWGTRILPQEWLTHELGLGHDQLHHVGCHVSFG